MDSRPETLKHIAQVRGLLLTVIRELSCRALNHDKSKLEDPELQGFDTYTPNLKTLTYGSLEYFDTLAKLKPTLEHHYAHNRHHPEHYPQGVEDMTLIDMLEMVCDWKAASLRHSDGDISKSLEVNQKRFGISDQLLAVLRNTVRELPE